MSIVSENSVRYLPDHDRLSVVTGVVLLAFTLMNFIDIEPWETTLQISGFFLSIRVSIELIALILVSALTAAGADWLFHDHPRLQERRSLPHILLPSVTVLGIGILLVQLPFGIVWWFGLAVGGALLAAVLVGEYISIDSHDTRQPLAAAILIAVSFGLYLVLTVGLHLAQLRLFFLIPGIFIGTWLVCMRSFHLRLQGEWLIFEAVLIAFIIAQFSAGLLYWPITPLRYGLFLLGPTYGIYSLFSGLIEEEPVRKILVLPIVVMVITTSLAIWIQ